MVGKLAGRFLSLLRSHSRLKRASARKATAMEVKRVRQHCHENFWGFAKDLLDKEHLSQVFPSFSSETAESYFKEVYQSGGHSFQTPSWLPTPPLPQVSQQMVVNEMTMVELERAIKKSKHSSAPSPFDRIPYLIFKKCPSLATALLNLFNCVLTEGVIPSSWKRAAVKLIAKSSALEDPSLPSNFRPIGLTPTVSKLLSAILKDRWLRHMRSNGYLHSDIQKAFLPTIPGVTKHQSKLATIIWSAKTAKRSLAVAWLDIANAYGSVDHSLIQFALRHYHAPSEFCNLLQSWYSGLSATISSQEWVTSAIPLQVGVYQTQCGHLSHYHEYFGRPPKTERGPRLLSPQLINLHQPTALRG